MAQRSITSFFTKVNQKTDPKEEDNIKESVTSEQKKKSTTAKRKRDTSTEVKKSSSKKPLVGVTSDKPVKQSGKRIRSTVNTKKSPVPKKSKLNGSKNKKQENESESSSESDPLPPEEESSEASSSDDDDDDDQPNERFTRGRVKKPESASMQRFRNIIDSDTSSDDEKNVVNGKHKNDGESTESKTSKKLKEMVDEDSSSTKDNEIIQEAKGGGEEEIGYQPTSVKNATVERESTELDKSATTKKLKSFAYKENESRSSKVNENHPKSKSNSKELAEENETLEVESNDSQIEEKNKTKNKLSKSTTKNSKKLNNIAKKSPSSKKIKKLDEPENIVIDNDINDMTKQEPKENGSSKKNESPVKKNDEGSGKSDKKKNDSPVAKKLDVTGVGIFGKTKNVNESLDYNPSSSSYHPINDAFWKEGQKVPYLALTKTFELIENISARLKIVEILSNYFRSVIVLSPDDLIPSIYLCLNQLAPAYEGLELGIAETNLMKAIASSTGRTLAQIKAELQKVGDLGVIAEESRFNQKMMFQPPPLTINTVFTKLKEIATTTGTSSGAKKVDKIQSLFVACRHSEARYLIRCLAGKLRIGLAEQSVLQSLALATAMTPPDQNRPFEILNASKGISTDAFKQKYDETALIIKTTYCQCPNYNKIVPVLLEKGVKELPNACKLTPGIPLKPMLAHPTKGIQEVLSRFEGLKFTCEFKYDGERAQIHILEDGSVNIFSRNQENNTSKYPDLIARIPNTKSDQVKSCVLDCEAVAWDKEKKQILPFQVLSTRKRKDANEAEIKVQVCVFMFDLLYLNGNALVEKPFQERRGLLRQNFKEVEGEWYFASSMDVQTMDEVQVFLDESIKGNCEGLMIKTLEKEATYEIAKRSRNWLKLKKDYLEGVGDTLDLVVIGGYIGKGKRTGTYGGFLLACYDQENEEYQSICKIGTGFSEDDLLKHTEALKECVIDQAKSYYRCDSSLEPDHWFESKLVWEVKCADLSLSPVHGAAKGIVDPEKGISLRFPRFIRVRDDKNSEDATSAQQIADMYLGQEQIKNQSSSNATQAEEDFY